jgi:hypothetical protein
MLAYLSWHRPAAGVQRQAYEQALVRFHRSLAHRPPSGFRSSAAMRLDELPWLAGVEGVDGEAIGYEDWYLVDDWAAVGVLEEAAVARGHETAHHAIAARAGAATGSVFRLLEGCARPGAARTAVWVAREAGHDAPSLGALLGDGMDPQRDGLWRRCLGLGPTAEYCLLVDEAPAGVAASRLPSGWVAHSVRREAVWDG